MRDSPIPIALFGASGRFGLAIASIALSDPQFSLVSALTHAHSPHLGADLGALLHQKPLGLPLSTSLQGSPEVLIDASLPPGLADRLSLALERKLPLVIGTTGLSDADLQHLVDASSRLPLFHSSNFSIGMALLRKLAQEAARHFPPAHIDLIETHHAQKKDAPSGSALLLAKTLSPRSIQIHSLRSGHIVGEHTLLFNTAEEKLTLSHAAHSRSAFARGALLAAAFLIGRKPGLYSMEDLFIQSPPT